MKKIKTNYDVFLLTEGQKQQIVLLDDITRVEFADDFINYYTGTKLILSVSKAYFLYSVCNVKGAKTVNAK